LPVCPLAKQRRIVAKVDQLIALMNQLETRLPRHRQEFTRSYRRQTYLTELKFDMILDKTTSMKLSIFCVIAYQDDQKVETNTP
jgi:hypothetical protein